MLQEGTVVRATALKFVGENGVPGEVTLHDNQMVLLVIGHEDKSDDPKTWSNPIGLVMRIGLYPTAVIPQWLLKRLKVIAQHWLRKEAAIKVATRIPGVDPPAPPQEFTMS